MSPSLVSALAALCGALIGGLASLGSSWLTQWIQLRDLNRERERSRREALFSDFINEASRLYGDALSHEKDDVADLVRLYAILGRIRLVATPAVVAAAERTMDGVITTYLAPNKSLHELKALLEQGGMNFLHEFGTVGRAELEDIGKMGWSRTAGPMASAALFGTGIASGRR